MLKKIGLALGGGFVLGAAHVGVLKVLEDNGIKPHIVAGTSAGSMVAALYAAGWTVNELEVLIRSLKPSMFIDEFAAVHNFFVMTIKLVSDVLHLPYPFRAPLGLMRGTKLEHFIRSKVGEKKFENGPLQLAITAVDITNGMKVIFVSQQNRLSLNAAKGQVFVGNVPVWQAVRASTAVPGIYEPKKIGDYLLVDGGLRENVPAQVLKAMGADTVIAVDLGNDGEEPRVPRNIMDMLGQTLDIIRSDVLECVLDGNADVRIRPLLKGVGTWDFHKVSYVMKQGERAALDLLPEIKRVCGKK